MSKTKTAKYTNLTRGKGWRKDKEETDRRFKLLLCSKDKDKICSFPACLTT